MAHILLIDDDAPVRAGMARFLRMQGHEVIEAEDGVRALRVLGGIRVDLVVTDINMPEMDGIEVVTALRAHDPQLPVIAVSGGGRLPKDLLLSSAELLGACATLAKPFDLAELRAVVEGALAQRAQPE